MSENAVREIGREDAAQIGVPTTARWQIAHEQLGRLARLRAGLDAEEGRWLLLAWREKVHARLGYGSFGE